MQGLSYRNVLLLVLGMLIWPSNVVAQEGLPNAFQTLTVSQFNMQPNSVIGKKVILVGYLWACSDLVCYVTANSKCDKPRTDTYEYIDSKGVFRKENVLQCYDDSVMIGYVKKIDLVAKRYVQKYVMIEGIVGKCFKTERVRTPQGYITRKVPVCLDRADELIPISMRPYLNKGR